MAFEKASVLFNIGGLYTQLGTRQDRSSAAGLDCAVDNFLRAAGTFQFIIENFSNAPSSDLGPDCLNMIVQLMLAQARECLFEKGALGVEEGQLEVESCLELSQEAAHLSQTYDEVLISVPEVSVIPYSWVCLLQVKREHYRALADYYLALPLSHHLPLSDRAAETFQFLHDLAGQEEADRPVLPRTEQQRKYLAKAHLREALLMHEEALRVNRMSSELRRKDAL